MGKSIHYILQEASYLEVFALTFGYFVILYFILGPSYLWACKQLEKKGLANKIVSRKLPKNQVKTEIKHSFVSLIIFGLSGITVIYLVRTGQIKLLDNSFINILFGVILLNVFNELHFFVVHRMMHIPFMLKHVHKVHHKSVVPTVYSVYSFHWIEALLLSTVPLCICPFIPFAPLAIGIYPLTSILLNYSGHCNYRFGNGKGMQSLIFGTKHNEHHSKGRQNFGFASGLMDRLYSLIKK